MIVLMQQTDAALLLFMSGCVMFLICEDKYSAEHRWLRAALALFGFLSFAQAMWLLGVWQPSRAGYPWPRLSLDGSVAILSLIRVVFVVRIITDRRSRLRHAI